MSIKVQAEGDKSYIHLLPGRLRVSVPGLQGNQTMARGLAYRLSKLSGIKVGYVNPVSGRILLYYERDKVNIAMLLGEMWGLPVNRKTRRTQLKPAPTAACAVTPPVATPGKIPWHALDTPQVLRRLQANEELGLTTAAAVQRLRLYGYNQLAVKPKSSLGQMLLEPLRGFMPKLLLLAAGVSLIVGEFSDALVIVVIVGLQAVIETVQGYRAEKSLAALQELSAPTANALRSGKLNKLAAKFLVPGDIISLEAGDRVPADARLLQAVNLTANESCLTGESLAVAKSTTICTHRSQSIGDIENMVFAGTMVTGGRCMAVVIYTGMQTEMGKIASLLKNVTPEPTVLQKQMEALGKSISAVVAASVSVIAILNLIQGRPILEILRTGVSLAVGAIPEGLPAVVTVALAAGVQRMVKRNAVVRRLPAVETLGSTTIICTDKTGTLTQNAMTVTEIFTPSATFEVSGEGYQPQGKLLYHQQVIRPEAFPDLITTLTIGTLCNNSELRRGANGLWEMIGDPTEGALVAAAAKAGLWWEDLRREHCREHETAFDSTLRMMSVVCRDASGTNYIYVKGAVDTVLERCSYIWSSDGLIPLDIKTRRNILLNNDSMAGKALRVISTAWKVLPPDTDSAACDLTGLVFAGLLGMVDPPRPGVKYAISKCHRAGIKVVMITGDHHKTAEAVAAKLGILATGASITGTDLNQLSEAALQAQVDKIVVYSRTSPDQKLRIVQALKHRGHIVAMTGDGVNDAPAVKEADIGVAMGIAGTDVTREAAGITLSDDNFSTIVAGIEEGRTVGENLTKSVRYVLSGSVGQVLAVFLAAVVGLPTPLLPPQILWINLVTEGVPAMALTGDPPHPECMNRPPLKPQQRFSAQNKKEIIRKGILTGLTTFGVYAGGLAYGWVPMKARTMAFSHLVMGRVFSLFDTRRTQLRLASTAVNPYILPAAGLSTGMLLLTMYVPVIRPLFSTIPMGLADWALIGFTSSFVSRLDTWFAKLESTRGQRRLPGPAQPVALLGQGPEA
ncbi:MAG: HAD-IC family P-type ATPase [Peptococcaceae bacterium]|nr:HAD-IC family P-type ATPase [Peptococcaceae bacterium]